jgi:hypothetical protein
MEIYVMKKILLLWALSLSVINISYADSERDRNTFCDNNPNDPDCPYSKDSDNKKTSTNN